MPKEVGSVKCKATPVSPFTPFNVMREVLPEGGTIVQAVAPVGGVIVLLPAARVCNSVSPGLEGLFAAGLSH